MAHFFNPSISVGGDLEELCVRPAQANPPPKIVKDYISTSKWAVVLCVCEPKNTEGHV
jgi:hypothetical protein